MLSGANVAADGPFALFTGEDTNSLGCLTYTIGGDQPITPVGQRRMDGTYAPDLLVVGDEFSLEGTVRCRVFAHPTVPDSYVLEEADGTPLFTVRGPYVFDGMIDLPPNNTPEFQKLLYTELAFSLQGPGVYEGPYWQGEVLATATVSDLRMATPRRRLLLAALTDGVCGAIGLHVMVPVP